MQEKLIFLILFAICSCTTIKKSPPQKISLELYDEISSREKYVQNKKIIIKYTTCRKRWAEVDNVARNYLRDEFKKKFAEGLYGLSNMEVEITDVIDSNIFMQEVCFRVKGNPVTKKLVEVKKDEYWELTNPAYHIH